MLILYGECANKDRFLQGTKALNGQPVLTATMRNDTGQIRKRLVASNLTSRVLLAFKFLVKNDPC